MFQKILIANRGEIAVRVIRTCREMKIPTVAVYSEADRTALHVRMAEEAVCIGAAPPAESYLHIDRILEAARQVGAEAIHPGYGFLSENPAFAKACRTARVKFIGPSPESMVLMSSKTRAREAMEQAGVPIVPGTTHALRNEAETRALARQVGFPVMLKAVAGGGGKGMRLVRSEEELPSALEQAQSEARGAFGSSDVYIEKAIVSPRHVEVQILADEHGHVIHLGERECSLQRRHQKVVEETPSPLVDRHPEVREKITAAAVRVARAAGYWNAGTVEFLMDSDANYYFLEMNTRLQVEHPVTELVTGIDLVREQILIAAGEKLRYEQSDVSNQGSAIECRIYAEDPDSDFFPSPGRITALERPAGPGIRIDSGAYSGWTVPIEYDPLIAKLAAWAPTRDEAIARLQGALAEYHIAGIKTTLGFFRELLNDPGFCAGDIDTGFIGRWFENRKLRGDGQPVGSDQTKRPADEETVAILAAGLHFRRLAARQQVKSAQNGSAWKVLGKRNMLR